MVTWYDIVRKIFDNIQDIYVNCSKCSSSNECVEELPLSTPTDIMIFRGCCACILGYIMENVNGAKEIYIPIEDSVVILYKISDALIEVSEDTAIVVPLNKVEDFVEIIRDLGYEGADEIIRFIEKN